jgi:uncharacterized membrane protein YhdT
MILSEKLNTRQLRQEFYCTLVLTLLYMLAWFVSGYSLSSRIGFLGLPIWFEWSCIYAPLGFLCLCVWCIRRFFSDEHHC